MFARTACAPPTRLRPHGSLPRALRKWSTDPLVPPRMKRSPAVDCQAYAQTKTSNQARVFEGPEAVTPRDADELNVERLAHVGCGDVVDEEYDSKVKIGEALEAAAQAVGDHPVERSDAAAIRAAEARVVGPGATIPGGVAEQAEQAAESNATVEDDEDKVTIADVLKWNATAELPTDKAVTKEDAAAAVEAEVACAPGEATKPYGVGAALTEAARHNQDESW
ncbi:hypothetical protein QYE76_061936 [Lolium multiflorum]|uniref:SMP domain-containing protein n=1 Tax=Lolium multiflorum TaxID=4521 RepID=A0AAD8W561_LOLMU|nr:hypothetical protein QYE76_061936 [Lolium multiflorum]